MTDKDSERIGFQRYADAHLFEQWCNNFFDISTQIKIEGQSDRHHCRWFFIAIWELFESGYNYVDTEIKKPYNSGCEYLLNAKKYIAELKSLYTEADYFMLQYYRHSASHIFQHNYSWLDKKGNLNPDSRKFSFIDTSGSKYQLTYLEIVDKVKSVTGEYALGESSYRSKLISRAYSTIQAWESSQRKIVESLHIY